MTAYNREKYIAEAIESVMNSTYQNWELIIVDDCSKDRTVEIAKSYEARDHRIKVYINETNLGDYPNRNRAASYAKGKYLKYVDADDMIYSHGLKVMVDSMEKFPSAAIGLCKEQNNKNFYPYLIKPYDAYIEHFFNKSFLANAPTSVIINGEVFRKLNGFSGMRHVSDYELWLRTAQMHDLVIIVNGLTFWRSHDEQEKTLGSMNFYRDLLNYQVEINFLESDSCPFDNELKEKAKWRIQRKNARKFLKFIKKGKYKNGFEYFKVMKLPIKNIFKAII